jgi:uncharacterized protein (DUF2267 family)
MPMEYAHASQQFDCFVEELRIRLGHETRHQTFQTIQSVLRVFRRRLPVAEGLRFADALPAVLRALFVEDWDIDEPVRSFATLREMNNEVREFRINHDFSPPTAIEDVAFVLRHHVDPIGLHRALQCLSPEASAFWHVTASPA